MPLPRLSRQCLNLWIYRSGHYTGTCHIARLTFPKAGFTSGPEPQSSLPLIQLGVWRSAVSSSSGVRATNIFMHIKLENCIRCCHLWLFLCNIFWFWLTEVGVQWNLSNPLGYGPAINTQLLLMILKASSVSGLAKRSQKVLKTKNFNDCCTMIILCTWFV